MISKKDFIREIRDPLRNLRLKNITESDKDIIVKVLKISVRDLSKNDISKRELPKNSTGVVVTKIFENSPLKFISVNDVIVELQKKKITNSNQFSKLVNDILNKGQKTLLFAIYNANGQRSYLTVKLN